MMERSDKQGRMLSRNDVIAQFADAMRAAGLIVEANDIVADSPKFQRCKSEKDRGSRKNGFYKLWIDEHPAGVFGVWSTGESHTWAADTGAAPLSTEERAKLRVEMKRRQAERAAEIRAAQDKAAERAKKIWDKAVPADDSHPYLVRKGVKAHGLRVGKWWKWDAESGKPYVACENALLVPQYGIKRDIRSLQAIFPERIDLYGEQRDKDYLSGGERAGQFHVIGKPLEVDEKKVFVVCEGYATAASIYQATGHCAIVAFDTGGLLPAARVIREKYSSDVATIVFAADNDWSVAAPVKNPGVHYATKAAAEVGGVVAVPQFANIEGLQKGGDFNDLHQREGVGAVEAWINAALYPPSTSSEAESGDLPWEGEPEFPPEAQDVPRDRPSTQAEAEDLAAQGVEDNAGFRILGYHRETIYIFVYEKKQIIDRDSFSLMTLLHIAPLNFWEVNFPGKGNGGSVNVNQAAEFIIRTAHRRGLYDPNRVRNGGAWSDDGRHVFHHGDHLTVDGQRMPVTSLRSRFTYEATLPLPAPADVALTDAEGQHILGIAERFNWERNSSAALLAGWTFLSPICGALKWRPHIFLTGPAGNGKSTILRDFVHAMIGRGGCVFAQGSSTEAGVRQDIGSTALPVLLDEAERNTEREQQRIEALFALIRQSSTESDAQTLKGTIGGEGLRFNVRSMFCLAAIFTGLERKADIDRLSVLALKPSRGDAEAARRWDGTKDLLHRLADEDDNLRGKMMRRVLDSMPQILATVEVFKRVATDKFGSARDGDQLGTMLAGAWSLCHAGVATPEQARAMMDGLDWSDQNEATESDDSQGALSELMGAFVTVLGMKHSVHSLISFALGEEVEGRSLDARQARTELKQHGIGLDGNKLVLSNSSTALKRLLHGTPFATDPRAAFMRLPGAMKGDKQVKFNGMKTRVTLLPLEAIGFGSRSIASENELF